MDSLASFLSTLDAQHRLVEIGAGNGELASFLLTQRTYRQRAAGSALLQLPEYIGLDVAPDTLAGARAHILTLQGMLSREGSHALFGGRMLVPLFSQGTLEGSLPFPSGQFHCLVFQLIFGHLPNPLLALQEGFRVLASGGRLLLLTLKPTANLPRWYHTSILPWTAPDEGSPDSESLLDILCEFERGFRVGAFHRPSHQELTALLASQNATIIRVESVLDDQGFLTVAQKP